ncbi:EAL domain-containing protein [Nostoc sp. CHAB 5784]|uniref:bifunctional diguanylate cyclase/phosphodiesterase n=1 Tax=Nostoc mirabile TaxID=2907820 RepID=UPI001E288AF8|nr:EAL domain-containing protein [Nostoc mirabile]MCC5664345.1 EAL domain-containing protein [Nostoc mirabile CHAB5784]
MEAPVTNSEADRLNALEKYKSLNLTAKTAFDDINRLATQICKTPIALISLIDNTRQWFQSQVGWEISEIKRDTTFCTHTIQQTELYVIQDTLADERFATNPLVISEPNIRFYAGMPLITPEGYAIGTLCVMDYVPRELTTVQKETLQILSRQVVTQLELRRLAEHKWVEACQLASEEIEIRVEEGITQLRNTNERLHNEIVQHQQMEIQLRRREQELSDFLENAAIGLHWVGADGMILWANQAELNLLGYSREEYIGHHITNFFADQDVIDDILQRLIAKETLNNYEARLLCKDGSIKYVLIDSNVFWENDQFIYSRCFVRDITARKQVEEVSQKAYAELELRVAERTAELINANEQLQNEITDRRRAEDVLRQSEERFRCLSACSPVGIFMADIYGQGTYTNPRCQAIGGFTFEESLGSGYAQFIHPDDREWMLADWAACVATGQEHFIEYRFQSEKGGVRWVHARSAPMFDDTGVLIGYVGTIEDITERKQAEKALQQAYTELESRVAERTTELINANKQLRVEIAERKQAEKALQKARDQLELRVQKRTSELAKANEELQKEIAERKLIEQELLRSNERFTVATSAVNCVIYEWDIKQKTIERTAGLVDILGYSPEEAQPSFQWWIARIHLDEQQHFCQQIAIALANKSDFALEYRICDRNNQYRYVWDRGTIVRNSDGQAIRIVGSTLDITDRKQIEEQLLYDALHDRLTGLPNRALFIDRLESVLKHAQRHTDYLFAVLFLDLDRFKLVNDSLGHSIGDQLLIAIAHRLLKCIRPSDTVARIGGDEFTILLNDIKEVTDVTDVADRIHKQLTAPFNLDGHEVFTTASIGIALSTIGYDRSEELLRDADIAMYRAKTLGKARYQVFGKEMHTSTVARLQLEMDLRRAIERQEFQLYYQPIVSLKTGILSGFEALLHWQHPDRGLIYPAEFISVAEETGLIISIGQWVLHQACFQMYEWQRQLPTDIPLTINVNFSSKQIMQPDLIEHIKQVLQETHLGASSLRVEITESVIMENTEAASSILFELKALGIQLEMDDFGTGYSSLSYLHRFPMDGLKIDRSFITRIGIDAENLEIVQAIVTLAHSLGMNVTAEGVETKAQLSQLQSLKCEYGQGYFFSKPVNSETAKALITKGSQW